MRIWKLASARLIIASMSLAAACTTGASLASSTQCSVSPSVTGSALAGAPAISQSLPERSLRLDRAYILSGDCAGQARSFVMEHVLLADGRVLAIGDGGALSVRNEPLSSIGPSLLSSQQAPRLGGASFVYAARLGPTQIRPPVGSAYVGVWSTGGKSIVAGFRISADGQATTPDRLLESDLPIVGVGYFPSPDSRSGQLGVVQRVSANTVRLLNYQWYHPGL